MCSNNVCRQASLLSSLRYLFYPLSVLCSYPLTHSTRNHTSLTYTSNVCFRILYCIHLFHYAFVIVLSPYPLLRSLSFVAIRYTIYADPKLTSHTKIYANYRCCILSVHDILRVTLMKSKRRDCVFRHLPRRLLVQPCRLPRLMLE